MAIACGRIWQILGLFNPFLPLWQDYSFALTFKSVTKSYGVTIQMKPFWENFCRGSFTSEDFTKRNLYLSVTDFLEVARQ